MCGEELNRLHSCTEGMGKRFIHRVDGGFQLGELGGRRVGRVDTVREKTIYRSSTLLVWVYEQGLYILEEVGECRTIPSTK